MMHWQQVLGNVSQYGIVLPPGDDSRHYQFGIALQSHDNLTSGVSWAHCVFRANSSKLIRSYTVFVLFDA